MTRTRSRLSPSWALRGALSLAGSATADLRKWTDAFAAPFFCAAVRRRVGAGALWGGNTRDSPSRTRTKDFEEMDHVFQQPTLPEACTRQLSVRAGRGGRDDLQQLHQLSNDGGPARSGARRATCVEAKPEQQPELVREVRGVPSRECLNRPAIRAATARSPQLNPPCPPRCVAGGQANPRLHTTHDRAAPFQCILEKVPQKRLRVACLARTRHDSEPLVHVSQLPMLDEPRKD